MQQVDLKNLDVVEILHAPYFKIDPVIVDIPIQGTMPASRRKIKKSKGETVEEEPSNDKTKKVATSSAEVIPNTARFGHIRRRVTSVVVGTFLLLYIAYFCYVRSNEGGVSNGMYDVLWLCNLSLVIAGIGMLIQNPVVIGTAIGCVAFSHMSWMFDVSYWILFDTFQIGRAKYLEEQEFDQLWMLTLHQFWFIPLCLTVLHIDYNGYGVKIKSWVYTLVAYGIMSSIAYFRFSNIMLPSASSHLKLQKYIFDFNTGHEFWLPSYKDTYNVVHRFDDSPWIIYIIWSLLIEAVLLNGSCFIFLKLFSLLLLEDLAGHISGREINKK